MPGVKVGHAGPLHQLQGRGVLCPGEEVESLFVTHITVLAAVLWQIKTVKRIIVTITRLSQSTKSKGPKVKI